MCGHLCVCVITFPPDSLRRIRGQAKFTGEARAGLREVPTVRLGDRLLAPGSQPGKWSWVGASEGRVCILNWGSAPKRSMTSETLGGCCVLMCPHPQKPRSSGPIDSRMPEALKVEGEGW